MATSLSTESFSPRFFVDKETNKKCVIIEEEMFDELMECLEEANNLYATIETAMKLDEDGGEDEDEDEDEDYDEDEFVFEEDFDEDEDEDEEEED